MNITTKVTVTYYATCDICDDAGPESVDKIDAMVAALEEGWEVTLQWNGLKHVSITLCPLCSGTPKAVHWAKARARPQYQTDPTSEEAPNGTQ